MSSGSTNSSARFNLLEEARRIDVLWHNVLSDCQTGIYLRSPRHRAEWLRRLRVTGHGIVARA